MSNQHSKCDDCYKSHLPEAHDRTILPSEAFGEGYVPEFNQASEDRLTIAIETLVSVSLDLGKQAKMMTLADVHTPQAIPDNEKLNMALQPYKDKVLHIIRTEELKLLDEVIHQSTVNLKSAKAVAGWAELRKKQLEAEL